MGENARDALVTSDLRQLGERRLDGETIFRGKVIDLQVDTVELPNGKSATREVILHKGAVAILPLLPSGEVLVEEQYRYPHDRIFLESPAGKLDSADEDPLSAAHRELAEETGYRAEQMISLGEYIPSPAILSERIHLYLAMGLTEGGQSLDEDEFLAVKKIPLSTLVDAVLRGEIPDGKTQAAVLRVHLLLERNALQAPKF